MLTGVDITSYGPDLPGKPTLGQMVRRLLAQVPELQRLRLSSLDPVEIDDDLWRLIAEEPRLMPHLHCQPAGRRRHGAEADEAPAPAGRRHRVLPRAPARCGPTWCSAPT